MKLLSKLKLCFVLALAPIGSVLAQAITWTPLFPTLNDSITITYDASQGSKGLEGVSPVFIHTGVVTGGPTATGWSLVQGTWGTAADSIRLTPLGNNKHSIKFHIRSYYGVTTQNVFRLAMVFRNSTGTREGKTSTNGDFFLPIYQPQQFGVALASPGNGGGSLLISSTDIIAVKGQASKKAGTTLRLLINGVQVTQVTDSVLTYNFGATGSAIKKIKLIGTNGTTSIADSFTCVVRKPVSIAALPPNANLNGITYLNNNSLILSLYAPEKEFVYVLGDFNNWQIDTAFYMNRTPNNDRYWIQINNLTAGQEYAYQFLINNQLKVADPYAEKVLDPSNDQFIGANYPGLKPYPTGKATGIVSVLQTAQTPYAWRSSNFQRPAKTDIVAYELHVRDFLANRRYKSLIDSLPYLQRLGVNCIEFMPLMEFEGNDSWGYNPSFHMAPDKAYGTKKDLQALIDSCHRRGISVVLDMVLNHAFGQNPMVQMYWDAANNKPATNSPWFNPDARHPFNVGYDFNHESPATKKYVYDVLRYWLREYRFDGFRFDLSKGFTQTNNPNDVGAWGNYDQSRINILKAMHDTIQAISPGAYTILEHFANNNEETALANYGMMLWGNLVNSYNEATMGWTGNSDLGWISYKNRGWQQPHVFAYMESHDEERLMVKNILYGNSTNANHDTKTIPVALNRMKLAAAFFFTIPGPKMIWQFGELGYDQSINRCPNGTISESCRTDAKPILWTYLQDANRRSLYETYAMLAKLKVRESVFKTTDFTLSVGNTAMKRITLNSASNKVFVIGNFAVTATTQNANFPQTGKWYEFFSGDSITVSNIADPITLQPGEYRLYSTKKMAKPSLTTSLADDIMEANNGVVVYPNPFEGQTTIEYQLKKAEKVNIKVYNSLGQEVATLFDGEQSMGTQSVTWGGKNTAGQVLPTGTYFCKLTIGNRVQTRKIVMM